MVKVKVLSKCTFCDGKAYLPAGKDVDYKRQEYERFSPCPKCHGSGMVAKWITLPEFQKLLKEAECSHEHVSQTGGFHFSAGEVWDDIEEVCSDCGEVLD